MERWMLRQKSGDFRTLGAQFHVNPLLILLLFNRGIDTEDKIRQFLSGTIQDFYDPFMMKDMNKATDIIAKKIKEKKPIRVIGDYDIDGVSATAILVKGLTFFDAQVDYAIPHRVKDGYGLNSSLVTKAKRDGIDTILTCDNGISAKVPIDLAKQYGLTVVVTDHHEVPYHEVAGKREFLLPAADAVIDPKQQEATYPFPGICGGFVAYKFILALYEKLKDTVSEEEFTKVSMELSELAAFATVGDIMELQDENRILVKEGILRMKKSKNAGLRALMKVLEIDAKSLNVFHLGFLLGPCINATGRLDTPDRAIKLLLASNEMEAMNLATELKVLNESRKNMTEDATKAAIEQIESGVYGNDKVLVIYLPECHESIAGIVAGRIKELYDRPTFVVTNAEDGLKGSARSIEAYHIFDEMTKINDIFTKYGGHAMAAGFSLPKDKLEEFRTRINAGCKLSEEDMQSVVRIDAEVPLVYFDKSVLEEFALLEPTGNGNEAPLFARKNMQFLSAKYLGVQKKAIVFTVFDTKTETKHEMKLFRNIEGFFTVLKEHYGETIEEQLLKGKTEEPVFLHVTYSPSLNTFNMRTTVQFVIEHYMVADVN